MAKIFDGQKKTKLGTDKNPAAVTVKTKKRMAEVTKIFEDNGWKYTKAIDVGRGLRRTSIPSFFIEPISSLSKSSA